MADDSENDSTKNEDQERIQALWGSVESRDQALDDAIGVLAKASLVNRAWMFEIDGNFEVVFGNLRLIQNEDGSRLVKWDFPAAVSMNFPLARDLHKRIGEYVERIEAILAEHERAAGVDPGGSGDEQ